MVTLVPAQAVVYGAVALAALLVLVEVAIRPLWVAALFAAGLIAVAGVGTAHEDITWWPLLLVAVATVLWGVMIARRNMPLPQQLLAAACFAGGSLLYAVFASDTLTTVLALATSILLPAGFASEARSALGVDSAPG